MNTSLYSAINLAHTISLPKVSGSQRAGYIAGGLIIGAVLLALGALWVKLSDGDASSGCGWAMLLVGITFFVVGAAAIFGI